MMNVPIAADTEPVDTVDEFEYQYDENETETFLVDLDLTSLNGPLPVARGGRESNAEAAGKGAEEDYRVQIVDLASDNPMVMYRRQMYSCSWVDMIGSSMFFTTPSAAGNDVHGAVRSDVDFTLLDTSHIKLVGQQASLVPKSRPLKRRNPSVEEEDEEEEEEEEEEEDEEAEKADGKEDDDDDGDDDDEDDGGRGGKAIVDGTALPGFSSTNWRTNIARRKQADFLGRLMQAKRSRGETDIVPTVGDRKGKAVYRLDDNSWAGLTAEQRVKLSNLSGRVVKGDARAVAALREMYSELPGVVLSNGEGGLE